MSAENNQTIAVVGGGSWGATLAGVLAKKNNEVRLWEFNAGLAAALQKTRTLVTLPQLKLPANVQVTNDLSLALRGAGLFLIVTPSHAVRQTCLSIKKTGLLSDGTLLVSATKGLEIESQMTMGAVINNIFPGVSPVVLSGPSHAEEVAAGMPVALVCAAKNPDLAEAVQQLFSSDTVRVYRSDDPLGVELAGSLKNIYAVACGIVDGLGLGDNTKAALQARGLVELTRLGVKLGARPATFFGLAGLGDMIVTCNSRHSRNRLLGEKIGQGKTMAQALSEMTMVAEGVNTTKAAFILARSNAVEVPIINEMHQVLFENKSPHASIRDLMTRQLGVEMEGLLK